MHHPLLSYLIPLFNHEKYIIETLDSVLSDSYPNFEIIVIDDGSTDCSWERLNEWTTLHPDINIKCTKRANKGIAETLNELIRLSNGTYLRPLASDDLLLPQSSEKLVSVLQANSRLAAAFAYCDVINTDGQIIAPNSLVFAGSSKEAYKKDLKKALINEWASCGSCLLWHKANFLNDFGQYDESIFIEDWPMFLKLISRDSIIFVDHIVAHYRVHNENKSQTRLTDQRIRNLKNHLLGGMKSEKLFTGQHLHLMRSQNALTNAKISYLEKEWLSVIKHLGQYFLFQLRFSIAQIFS